MWVTTRRLTAEAFAPFGQVISTHRARLGRSSPVATLENHRPATVPILAVSRIVPTLAPIPASAVERHPFSSQTFVPTDLSRYVLIVCPSGPEGEPAVERLLAFVADVSLGVNYAPATWHHPMTVLDRAGEHVVLRWDEGSAADTEWHHLREPLLIDIPDPARAAGPQGDMDSGR
jgi:ureidoglycolate lyase